MGTFSCALFQSKFLKFTFSLPSQELHLRYPKAQHLKICLTGPAPPLGSVRLQQHHKTHEHLHVPLVTSQTFFFFFEVAMPGMKLRARLMRIAVNSRERLTHTEDFGQSRSLYLRTDALAKTYSTAVLRWLSMLTPLTAHMS